MKHFRLFLLASAFASMTAMAQDETAAIVDSVPSPQPQYSFAADSLRMVHDIDSLKSVIKGLQKDLRREQEDKSKKKLQQQIADLKGDVSSLTSERDSLKGVVGVITSVSNDLNSRVDSLGRELADLAKFKVEQLNIMAEGVEAKWFLPAFSDIDLTQLEHDVQLYEKFAADDERIANAAAKLKALQADCQLYNDAIKAVNSPYDASSVAALTGRVKKLLDATTQANRKSELDQIYGQLRNYKNSVIAFQYIVKKVNAIIDEYGEAGAPAMINAELKDLEDERGYETDVNAVPWTRDRYKEYHNNISKKANPVGEVILRLKP